MTLPLPSLADNDWSTLRFIIERLALGLPAIQGVGRIEAGVGSITVSETDTVDVVVPHHLGVVPIVVLTSREGWPITLIATTVDDFTVEAAPTGNPATVGTYHFNWHAYGHDVS